MKSSSSSMFLAAFLAVAPLASRDLLVAAHGFVNDITIGGRKYAGPQVRQGYRAPGSSAVRQVEDVSPVKVNSPAMVCGTNAAPATEIADANAGDEVLFNWGAAVSLRRRLRIPGSAGSLS
jgi:Auxiliary Activity family 9 (formerly GH61)